MYAPVAPTVELKALLQVLVAVDDRWLWMAAALAEPHLPTLPLLSITQDLIDLHGPIRYIVLPSVAVEHKVLAGPFARTYR